MNFLILITTLVLSTNLYAGPGHGHSHGHGLSHGATKIPRGKTSEVGRLHIRRLIKRGKLDKSWNDSSFDKSEKKKFRGNTEWVVTFDNEKGVKGKKLYIFLRLTGQFVAANFTGK